MFNSYIVLFMNRVVFYFLTHVSWPHSNCDLMFVRLNAMNILVLLCAIPALTRNSRFIVFQCHISYFQCHIRNAPLSLASTRTL